ncbi:AP2 family [Plasmodium coatneyi]|uniref:AP2 family n=1 Tax=Plasmodium coatneyi TaxID=208452 RepID=A0A1B1E467_9APIC|nr:AP2 family [Plasmodium coatneyi]ANQ09767.1 AP2 family [Plasmodium coatneyi]
MSSGDSLVENNANGVCNSGGGGKDKGGHTNDTFYYSGSGSQNGNQSASSNGGPTSSDSEVSNCSDEGRGDKCVFRHTYKKKCGKSKPVHKYKGDNSNFYENENSYMIQYRNGGTDDINYETSIMLDEQIINTHHLGDTMTLDDGEHLNETHVNKIISAEKVKGDKSYKIMTPMEENMHAVDRASGLPNDHGVTSTNGTTNGTTNDTTDFSYQFRKESTLTDYVKNKSRPSDTDDEDGVDEEEVVERTVIGKNGFLHNGQLQTGGEDAYCKELPKGGRDIQRNVCRSKSEEIRRCDSAQWGSIKEHAEEKSTDKKIKEESNYQNGKHVVGEEKKDKHSRTNAIENYKRELRKYIELNSLTKKKVHMELFLHHQINCYDLLLEIRKKIPIWGEYEANFFFHWKKIMTICIEELKIYILIFRSLNIETVNHLDFFMLKIIVDELDELRKVHEPNYKPFIFTQECLNDYQYSRSFEKSPDIYVNMNEFIQPWYRKNFNKSMDIKKFLNSLDILENQKHKSYIIQAMEIPTYIFDLCDLEEAKNGVVTTNGVLSPSVMATTSGATSTNGASSSQNDTSKKVKKMCAKKKENNKGKNLNTPVNPNPRPKKRTGYYDLEIDGVVASFEARKGVYYDKSRKLWRANWKENGKIQTKGFSVNEYKSVQLARQKAIEWREKKEAELLL